MAVAFLSPKSIGRDITPQDPLERLNAYRSDIEYRQRTFGRFPVSLDNLREKLMEDGFLYIGGGHNDKVQCAYCGGVLSGWTKDDDVRHCHRKFFPDCPFVQYTQRKEVSSQTNAKLFGHPEYGSLERRIISFKTWPRPSDRILPAVDSIARAGLFYTGEADICQCYACGNQLYDWHEDDDPKAEHDGCFPDCLLSNNRRPDNIIIHK